MSQNNDLDPTHVVINNVKSSLFRHVHSDGAEVGVTPSQYVNVNFYSERGHIPDQVVYRLNEDQSLGDPESSEGDDKQVIAITREFEISVFLDEERCEDLIEGLQAALKLLRENEEDD